jgi:alpha-amylase
MVVRYIYTMDYYIFGVLICILFRKDYPKEAPICGTWILPPSRFVIQNDDHDQQNPGSSSRDMQSSGSVLLKDRNVALHRGFEVKLFEARANAFGGGSGSGGGERDDWMVRVVLSSYSFMESGANG